jgi:exodeoxyribonuclease V alpha subunit
MRPNLYDVHQQFAEYFRGDHLAPYAYLVSRKLSEGHICLDLSTVEQEKESLPAAYRTSARANPDLSGEQLVGAPGDWKPFIRDGERLYLQRYFIYETMILEGIRRLEEAEIPLRAGRLEAILSHRELIRGLFGDEESSPDVNWQMAAIVLGALNNLTLVTGGPGTGKTTTLSRLLEVLYTLSPEMTVALAAPTGKAAMRMAESLQGALKGRGDAFAGKIASLKPMTLHRLLRVVPGTPRFRHDAANPLPEEVIVVDEASMVDAALLAKLLDAVGSHSRLILLGDRHQLASVEAGSILGDLCGDPRRVNVTDARTARALAPLIPVPAAAVTHPLAGHIVELKKSYRFGASSAIGRLSRYILAGDAAAVLSEETKEMVDTKYAPENLERFMEGYEAYTREPDIARAYRLFNQQRVLCAVWEGAQGVYHLNGVVEDYLKRQGLVRPQQGAFYEHRPVMITRNYYEAGLFNGDTGILRKDAEGNLKAWFPDPEIPGQMRGVSPQYLSDAETVYAMTIHKSQGSEFDRVLVVLPARDKSTFLSRELLYTAVTRAKKEVLLQGTAEIIREATARSVRRVSGINERFDGRYSAIIN